MNPNSHGDALASRIADADPAVALPALLTVLDTGVRCARHLEERGADIIAADCASTCAGDARDAINPVHASSHEGPPELVADPVRVAVLVDAAAERLSAFGRAADDPEQLAGWFQAAADARTAAAALRTAAALSQGAL